MKSESSRWGWLAFSLGLVCLVVTWSVGAYALFCWGWVICSLCAGWLALTRLKLGLAQWLLVGGAMLNTAAGAANGLVMAANGMLMPVEPVGYGAGDPAFMDSPSDRGGMFCRLIRGADDAIAPIDDATVHYSSPTPHIVRGPIGRPAEPPRLAFLDDRHAVRICGEQAVYSKGDMMGFIGTVFLGIPGMVLLLLGLFWRRIRRKHSAPAD